MAYDAKVIEIIIASPNDVKKERQIVREVIAEWNAIYARNHSVVLLPVAWETHSSPELSGRPQQMINDRLLVHADILVGIFWTRLGSPTGKAISGSIEEIDEHRRQGKPVMLYFSQVPVPPDRVDQAQYSALQEFKGWAQGEGLVETFDSPNGFRDKFRRHLPTMLRDSAYLRNILARSVTTFQAIEPAATGPVIISEGAREILRAAASDPQGSVMIIRSLSGTVIQAGGIHWGEPGNRQVAARLEAAVAELCNRGLLKDPDGRGNYFEVTDAGYRLVENAN
jgi:hypothetical protein